ARAAVLRSERRAEEALIAGLLPGLAVDDALLFPTFDVRRHLALAELLELLAKQLVLFVEDSAFHGSSSLIETFTLVDRTVQDASRAADGRAVSGARRSVVASARFPICKSVVVKRATSLASVGFAFGARRSRATKYMSAAPQLLSVKKNGSMSAKTPRR